MIAWVVGVPIILMVMVLALAKLESRVIAPSEPSERIRSLGPDGAEQQVAALVAPVGPAARPARAS